MCRKLLTIVVSAVILTACTVSSDPRQGGLVGGLHGLSTGAYDARIQQRQEELTRQQSANQGLKEQSEALEREAQEQQIELAAEQKRMIKMEENLSSLEENVKRLKAKSGKQKAEIATLKRKIGDQRRQLKSLRTALGKLDLDEGNTTDPGRYQILKRERERLAEEYKRLLEYSQALSNAAR